MKTKFNLNEWLLKWNFSYIRLLHYLITFVGLALLYWVFVLILNDIPQYSGIPYGIVKALAGVILLRLVDEIMLAEIHTSNLLKTNAVGYALYIFSYAIIVAAAFFSA